MDKIGLRFSILLFKLQDADGFLIGRDVTKIVIDFYFSTRDRGNERWLNFT